MSKVWFITGASSGFGKLWAEAALERGDLVAATARDVARLRPLTDRFDVRLLPLRMDVSDRSDVFAAISDAAQHFGRLDVVLNSAGYGHWGMVEELTERELREQMDTNFFGAVWVAQAALPILRKQRGGHLIQVTSDGGVRAYPGIGAYHASKWAVEGLTESLAQETADFGFHVTLLEPGAYDTGFSSSIRTSAELPEYRESRDAIEAAFEPGDPVATVNAIMRLVDSPSPPPRLILGRGVQDVIDIYEERIRSWRAWEDVSIEAFRGPQYSDPEAPLDRPFADQRGDSYAHAGEEGYPRQG